MNIPSRKRQQHCQKQLSLEQNGFILPFVLLTIAAISLIAISSYNALNRSTEYMRLLQQKTVQERALISAEAETIYRFMISVADTGGMRIPGENETLLDLALDNDNTDLPPARGEIWSADGGIRQSNTQSLPVIVSYRDITGYAPLNGLDEPALGQLFTFAGFASTDAEKLAAELSDFMDTDNERRFRGGERPEYRLYGKPPPSNSPLRHVLEIGDLLSIPEEMGEIFWKNLSEITTIYPLNSTIKPIFALPILEDTFSQQGGINETTTIQQLISSDERPRDRARFLLGIPGAGGSSRSIEIEKSANHVEKPFKRFLISERTDGIHFGEPAFSSILAARETDFHSETESEENTIAGDNERERETTESTTGKSINDYPFIFSTFP